MDKGQWFQPLTPSVPLTYTRTCSSCASQEPVPVRVYGHFSKGHRKFGTGDTTACSVASLWRGFEKFCYRPFFALCVLAMTYFCRNYWGWSDVRLNSKMADRAPVGSSASAFRRLSSLSQLEEWICPIPFCNFVSKMFLCSVMGDSVTMLTSNFQLWRIFKRTLISLSTQHSNQTQLFYYHIVAKGIGKKHAKFLDEILENERTTHIFVQIARKVYFCSGSWKAQKCSLLWHWRG